MSSKREQALHMYINEQCTQRHIAETIGVSERTIYNWINDNAWDRLKKASYAAPAMIADNLCLQIVNLQEAIAGRAQGQQFPTMQEAEITRKLITCLEKLKRFPTTGQNMQVLETFRRFVWNGSPTDAAAIDRWKSRFIEGNAKNGFLPHELEYNTNTVTPFTFPPATNPDDLENEPPSPATSTPETRNFSQSEIQPQNTTQTTDYQPLKPQPAPEPNQKKSEIAQQPVPQPTSQPTSHSTSQPTSFPPGEGRDGATNNTNQHPSPNAPLPPSIDSLLAPLRKYKEELLLQALANQNTHNSHPTSQPTSQPTSLPPGEGRDGALCRPK